MERPANPGVFLCLSGKRGAIGVTAFLLAKCSFPDQIEG